MVEETKLIDTFTDVAVEKSYSKDLGVFDAKDKPLWERISFTEQPDNMSEEDEVVWKVLLGSVAKWPECKHVIASKL